MSGRRRYEQGERGVGDGRGLGKPARADVATGEMARFGRQHVHPAAAERVEVRLDRGVLPHLGVHRGADEDGRSRRQQGCGQQIVGDPGRVLPEQLRGRGRDEDQVGRLAEACVRNGFGAAEEGRPRGLRRERRERECADEALRVIGEHRRDVHAGVDEAPADLDRLVRGNSPTYTQDDPGHRGRHRSPGGSGGRVGRAGVSAASPAALAPSSSGTIRSYTILPSATSSSAIDSGLRDSDVTCGGTIRPSPSPSWL